MNEEELKRLIGKYYEGISTDEDEKALRSWFTENDAPEGYEAEKEIFGYYMDAAEVPEPSAGFEARIKKAIDNSDESRMSYRVKRLLLPVFSAAAGLLILAGSYFFLIHRSDRGDTFSDPKLAYAETMKILMDVSAQMNHGTSPLKKVGRIYEVRAKSFKSINKSAIIVQKNLRNLEYLRNPEELTGTSK